MFANVLWGVVFLVGILALNIAITMLYPPDYSLSFGDRFKFAMDNMLDALYRTPRRVWVNWRCGRARKYLMAHDHSFRMQEASVELVRRRQTFYASGGRPDSAECPDILGVLDDWGYSPFKFR